MSQNETDNDVARWIVGPRSGLKPPLSGEALRALLEAAQVEIIELSGPPDRPRAVIAATPSEVARLEAEHGATLIITRDQPLEPLSP